MNLLIDLKTNKLFFIATVLTCLFAVTLQIQISLLQSEGYLGLRINLADFLIPVTGLFVLLSLLLKKTSWPRWRLKYLYGWMAILSFVLAAALINGYMISGEWSRWAIINKFTGWFVLLAYLGLGGWLRTNFAPAITILFARIFTYVSLIILLIFLTLALLFDAGIDITGRIYPIAGLMYNRNAYAFLLLVTIILVGLPALSQRPLISPMVQNIFWLFLPLAWMHNGSRTGWICAFILLLAALATHFKTTAKTIIPLLCLGIIIVLSTSSTLDTSLFREGQITRTKIMASVQSGNTLSEEELKKSIGERVRIRMATHAFDLWKSHPIQGAGLGQTLHTAQDKYGTKDRSIVDLVDCTILWLLTETGLVGLLLFLSFYTLSGHALWRDSNSTITDETIFLRTVLLIMLTFGLMSLMHELLYTRYLWMFMGLALAQSPQLKE